MIDEKSQYEVLNGLITAASEAKRVGMPAHMAGLFVEDVMKISGTAVCNPVSMAMIQANYISVWNELVKESA